MFALLKSDFLAEQIIVDHSRQEKMINLVGPTK